MSLIKRNSPRLTRARQENTGAGEIKSPTLSPVVKNIPYVDKIDTSVEDRQQEMLEKYAHNPKPVQLNRAAQPEIQPEIQPILIPEPTPVTIQVKTFGLLDLSFFCEERIYNILWLPIDISTDKIRTIHLNNIHDKLSVYSEYIQEATLGSFKENLHFYKGEILIPEEFLNITGFMRKFLGIERVHVLYETGEIILKETNYCNFWRKRNFLEPKNIPISRPAILDEEVCFDCNLSCLFRHRQQMTK